MITLGLSAPAPAPAASAVRLGLEYSIPFAAFTLSVPVLVASLPEPRLPEDYLVVGCTATFVAMIATLFLITRRQMKAFERSLVREESPVIPRPLGRPLGLHVVTWAALTPLIPSPQPLCAADGRRNRRE